MKYNKNIEKLYDKIKGNSYTKKLNDLVNNLSTGGPVERSIKKRVGNIANKGRNRYNLSDKIYKAIDKMYNNISKQQEKIK